MPRLLGVEIPAEKRIEASLTYIYGIGFGHSQAHSGADEHRSKLASEKPYAAAIERNHSRDHEQQDQDRRRSASRHPR